MTRYNRPHYEEIAATISECATYPLFKASDGSLSDYATVPHDKLKEKFADMFEKDNPNFNRMRFLRACGVQE